MRKTHVLKRKLMNLLMGGQDATSARDHSSVRTISLRDLANVLSENTQPLHAWRMLSFLSGCFLCSLSPHGIDQKRQLTFSVLSLFSFFYCLFLFWNFGNECDEHMSYVDLHGREILLSKLLVGISDTMCDIGVKKF